MHDFCAAGRCEGGEKIIVIEFRRETPMRTGAQRIRQRAGVLLTPGDGSILCELGQGFGPGDGLVPHAGVLRTRRKR